MKHLRFTIFSIAAFAALTGATSSFSQNSSPASAAGASLAPFGAAGAALNPAWRLNQLPKNKGIAASRFELVNLDGEVALKVSTDKSYGVLSHAWGGAAPATLSWRWRVDQPLANADIAVKSGDDAALKVCVMFDQPLGDIPFFQRAGLSLARSVTGDNLPSATLCYLWDARYPRGTQGANPYTARVRYIVLDGKDAAPGQWTTQSRRVAGDFAKLFGKESATTPPVIAVVVGADSDNTGGQSLAYLSRLSWLP